MPLCSHCLAFVTRAKPPSGVPCVQHSCDSANGSCEEGGGPTEAGTQMGTARRATQGTQPVLLKTLPRLESRAAGQSKKEQAYDAYLREAQTRLACLLDDTTLLATCNEPRPVADV